MIRRSTDQTNYCNMLYHKQSLITKHLEALGNPTILSQWALSHGYCYVFFVFVFFAQHVGYSIGYDFNPTILNIDLRLECRTATDICHFLNTNVYGKPYINKSKKSKSCFSINRKT